MTDVETLIGRRDRNRMVPLSASALGLLATVTWTMGEVHSNREAMRETPFGDVLLAGTAVLGAVTGAWHAGRQREEVEALLGQRVMTRWADARLRAPVLPDSELIVDTEIVAVEVDDGGTTLLVVRDRCLDGKGGLVAEIERHVGPAPRASTR